jgi:hypothetical protein
VLKAEARSRAKTELLFCGSGLAREKPETAAFIQNANVIVNDLREQARSHIWTVPALAFDFALQHSSRPGGRCAFAFDLRRPVKPRSKAGVSTPSKSLLVTFGLTFKSDPL